MKNFIAFIGICLLFLTQTSFGQNIPNGQILPPATSNTPRTVPTGYGSYAPAFVRSWTAKLPTQDVYTVVAATSFSQVAQSTNYMDGMGRTIQSVTKKATNSGLDLVSAAQYDNLGRTPYQYLPYVSVSTISTADGNFKTDPFNEQQSFLSGKFPAEQFFYSQTNYDGTPLNRVMKTMSAGNNFTGSSRGVSYKYETNGPNEVRIFDIASATSSIPTSSGFYNEAALQRNVITDDQGKRVVEYKDNEGLLLLKKVEITSGTTAADIAQHAGWLCTYYVYDDISNARSVITPRAVQWLVANNWATMTTTIMDELCYRTVYDKYHRPIIKKSPGAGEEYLVYDMQDRLVLTQDGNQRTAGKWMYYNYDDRDRVTKTGLWDNATSRQTFQDAADAALSNPYPVVTANYEILTEKYYDSYNWVSGSGAGLNSSFDNSQTSGGWTTQPTMTAPAVQQPYPLAQQATNLTTDLPTGSKVKVLGTTTFLYTVTFYDKDNNILQTQSTNNVGGTDIITLQHTYDGKIIASKYRHIKGGTNSQAHDLYTRMEYDAVGQLIRTFKRINSFPERLLYVNTYNEMGQLTRKVFGPTTATGANPLETQDYAYNLKELRGVNETFVYGTSSSSYFGEVLNYDVGFSTASYNGSLSGVQWRSKGDGERRALGFGYDAGGRMLKSEFNQYTSGAWNKTAGFDFSTTMGNGTDPAQAYDANGNILAVTQTGTKLYQPETFDQLVYRYKETNWSNRLEGITDNATGGTAKAATTNILGDFKDNNGATTVVDYGYDDNGNTTQDGNKGISSIAYNLLNLPATIQVDNKGTIQYTYDASGERLRKGVMPTSGTATTYDYAGPFIYQNDVLQYITMEEGRVRLTPGQGTGIAYDFFLKDRLGNVRAILTDELKSETYPQVTFESANATQEAQYYERTNYNVVTRPSGASYFNSGSRMQALGKPYANNTMGIGVGKLLKVMVKDKIDASVVYYYKPGSGSPYGGGIHDNADGQGAITDILTYLLNGAGAPSPVLKGNGAAVTSQLNATSAFTTFFSPQSATSNSSDTKPKAFLNILFFDEQFRFVQQSSQMIQVANFFAASTSTLGVTNVEAPKNGYVYVYINNESTTTVYFDNFQVKHTHGPLLEENHFNPFGSKMAALCSQAYNAPQFRLGYQSKELDNDLDLGLYDFEARYYDPAIGRFMQQDPEGQFASGYTGMGNNWPGGVDPDGRWLHLALGALIGGVINVATHWNQINSFKDGLAAFGIGAVSGFVVAATGGAAAAAVGGSTAIAGAGGFIAGAVGGAVGAAFGDPIRGIGNAIYFGDTYGVRQWVTNTVIGGVTGGLINGTIAAIKGWGFWNGVPKTPPPPPTVPVMEGGDFAEPGPPGGTPKISVDNPRFGGADRAGDGKWTQIWNGEQAAGDAAKDGAQAVKTTIKVIDKFDAVGAFKKAISSHDGVAELTNAGRAVSKHPSYFGYKSFEELQKVYRSARSLNDLASKALKNILRNGVQTVGAGGRYPNGWVTYTLSNGNAASWHIDGTFIGFRGIK